MPDPPDDDDPRHLSFEELAKKGRELLRLENLKKLERNDAANVRPSLGQADLHQSRLGQGVSAEPMIGDREQPIDDVASAGGGAVGAPANDALPPTVLERVTLEKASTASSLSLLEAKGSARFMRSRRISVEPSGARG
jgi:hypothetical protein